MFLQPQRARVLKTAVLMYCFLVIGSGLVIIGPTLLDLSQQTGQSLTVVSATLSARSAGYIVGSCLMGWLYPKVNFQVTAVVCLLLCALSSYAVPFLSNIWFLLAVFVVNGCSQSAYETGGYVFVSQLWGSQSAASMQAATLFFSAGALIAPLIARPFLTNPDAEDFDDTSNGTTGDTGSHADLRLYYPYSILGSMFTLAMALNLVLWCLSPLTPDHESRAKAATQEKDGRSNEWKVTGVILCLAFVFFYYGIDLTFGSFLVTFAVKSDLRLSKSTGALMTTVYWASAIVPKAIAIMIAKWVSSERMIACSLLVMLCGNVVLVPFGNNNESCLWIGVAVVGVGLSAIWGAMFAFVEQVIGLSSATGSLLIVSAMIGEFVFPFLISFFIASDARILLWTVLSCTLLCTVIFSALMIMKRTVLRIKHTE